MARVGGPSAVLQSFGEAIEVSEVAEPDRKGRAGKSTVGIGAEPDPLAARDRGDVLDVIEAVLDRRVTILVVQETTEEIEADHAVPEGDRLDLVIAKVAWISTGDRCGVGVGRAHRTARAFEHVVEGRFREM